MEPTLSIFRNLLHEDYHQYIIPVRAYPEKNMGKVSAEWWCAVDTILLSLQKLIKIKRNADDAK